MYSIVCHYIILYIVLMQRIYRGVQFMYVYMYWGNTHGYMVHDVA